MMRTRQVKPEFFRDAKLRDLTPFGRLLYLGLWMEADDGGWLRWDPEQIMLDLFPYELGPATLSQILETGASLKRLKRLRTLKCGHGTIPTLTRHQRFAGPTHRVYTIRDEHARCAPNRARPRGDPRVPVGSDGSPPGQVRSGQVSSTRASAQDPPTTFMGFPPKQGHTGQHPECLVCGTATTPENGTAESYLKFVNNTNPQLRDDARKHLTAMGVKWQSADTKETT